MSTPSAVHTSRSTGYPTPMRYRGLAGGSFFVHCETTFQNSCLSSPPASPPMAYPGSQSERAIMASRQMSRSSGSSPPWTIPNRFWSCGLECAPMHRSIHRIVRCMACSTRLRSGSSEETTSSSAIMMSAPIWFWSPILFSGVRSISEPSTGLWKCTPVSLMVASSIRETIWKPPESVSRLFGHDMNL